MADARNGKVSIVLRLRLLHKFDRVNRLLALALLLSIEFLDYLLAFNKREYELLYENCTCIVIFLQW